MSVNIIDVDTFTDPIVAPADSDPADTTYLITAVQGLANRTRSLKNRIDGGDTIEIVIPATAFVYDPSDWSYANISTLVSAVNAAQAVASLRDHSLPDDAEITAVQVLVNPSNTGADTMSADLIVVTHDFSTPSAPSVSVLGTVGSSGTAIQRLDFTVNLSLPYTFVSGGSLHVVVRASADGGTNTDVFYGVRIVYTSAEVEKR